jgi:hypothetical protein
VVGEIGAVTWKGRCTVHDDDETKQWFHDELAAALQPEGDSPRWVREILDSPRRVVLEVEPTQRIGYDGRKMGRATVAWIAQRSQQTEV